MRFSMFMAVALAVQGLVALPARPEPVRLTNSRADEVSHDIIYLLEVDRLIQIMSEEVVAELEQSLGSGLRPQDAAALRLNLQRIYAPDRIMARLREALADELAGMDRQTLRIALRFYASPTGRRIIGLELSARQALLDFDQAEIAEDALMMAQERGDPRLEQIERLIATTNVVEAGVVSGLNGSIQVARGFHAAMGHVADPAELTADAARLEDQLRSDVSQWVQRLLLLAYQPLGDEDVEALIVFVSTAEARDLSDCLNRAFDAAFMRLLFEVGMINGAALGGEET